MKKIVTVQFYVPFQEMNDALRTFASKPEHKKADSAVVAILSHGVEGAVCGTDSTGTCM